VMALTGMARPPASLQPTWCSLMISGRKDLNLHVCELASRQFVAGFCQMVSSKSSARLRAASKLTA